MPRQLLRRPSGAADPKLDKSGKLLKSWGEGMFVFPHGATVDRQGNLWVTDAQIKDGKGYQVFKFSPEGKVPMTLGKAGVASPEPWLFDEPTDVLVAPNGDIFVTEGHSGGTVGNDRENGFGEAPLFAIGIFGSRSQQRLGEFLELGPRDQVKRISSEVNERSASFIFRDGGSSYLT